MPTYIKPINISDFPKTVYTNCFGFAIGDVQSHSKTFGTNIYNLNGEYHLNDAFIKTLRALGYDELPRQISTVDEAHSNEYVLMVIASEKCTVTFPFREVSWNYHIVRRELDGTWVHKPGWEEYPCEIRTDADWNNIHEEFGHKYVLFAVVEK